MKLLENGVLSVRLRGPLTRAVLRGAKAAVLGEFAGRHIAAFVVDFRCAVVAVGGDDLDATLEGERHGTILGPPAALIVSPVVLPMFAAHAMRMAQLGIVRRVFTDWASALRWASRHAERRAPPEKTET